MEDIFPLPFPEVNAGLTEDGKGFITFFGNRPVYRSFGYDPILAPGHTSFDAK